MTRPVNRSTAKARFEPRSATLNPDALTTMPTRQWKMVYDFDVVCLMPESTTSASRLHSHSVASRPWCGNSSSEQSSLNLDHWSRSSRKFQDIWIEKPDERHKFLIPINAYRHPSICTTGASWDFLEEMEDKLGDTIMIFCDFNARSSLWDRYGTNLQRCALEEALKEILFAPVSSPTHTHLSIWQSDTDSTIDLALGCPRLAPWTRPEACASHRSDYLPVVFSLQKSGIKPRRRP